MQWDLRVRSGDGGSSLSLLGVLMIIQVVSNDDVAWSSSGSSHEENQESLNLNIHQFREIEEKV